MSQSEAIGMVAEAAQDLASAGLAHAAGNLYNCADLCNQVAEKALQAVHVARYDRRAPYDHNLRTLGETVNVPAEMLPTLDTLTTYYPETFLGDRLPEDADLDMVGVDLDSLIARTRAIVQWARKLVLA
jgi:HEPN domain-containing protein